MLAAEIQDLAEATVARLTAKELTLATAESCTGGLIAAALTEVPGASRVFRFGWVTYGAEAKVQELQVPAELIARHTVVSEPVVCAMAAGARHKSGADYAVAVSGNAGPTAAEGEPPVGTVCIALASLSGCQAITLFRSGLSRSDFRRMVVRESLQLLIAEL